MPLSQILHGLLPGQGTHQHQAAGILRPEIGGRGLEKGGPGALSALEEIDLPELADALVGRGGQGGGPGPEEGAGAERRKADEDQPEGQHFPEHGRTSFLREKFFAGGTFYCRSPGFMV